MYPLGRSSNLDHRILARIPLKPLEIRAPFFWSSSALRPEPLEASNPLSPKSPEAPKAFKPEKKPLKPRTLSP